MGVEWFGLIRIQAVKGRVHIVRVKRSINQHTPDLSWTEHLFHTDRFYWDPKGGNIEQVPEKFSMCCLDSIPVLPLRGLQELLKLYETLLHFKTILVRISTSQFPLAQCQSLSSTVARKYSLRSLSQMLSTSGTTNSSSLCSIHLLHIPQSHCRIYRYACRFQHPSQCAVHNIRTARGLFHHCNGLPQPSRRSDPVLGTDNSL